VAKMEPWKAEDEIFQEFVTQMRISPDGKWLVWVKSTGDKEKDARVSNLYLSSLIEDKEIALTRGERPLRKSAMVAGRREDCFREFHAHGQTPSRTLRPCRYG